MSRGSRASPQKDISLIVKECSSATRVGKQEEKKVQKKADKVQNCWNLVEVIVRAEV
jgi:hypothetical protein